MSQPLHIKGALLWDGDKHIERDLYIKKGRIVAENPNHAMTIDLAGCTLCPGLINAHDHLELNHYPRTKFREVYDNAHQWGEDVDKHLDEEPFKTLRNYPVWDRLFIGGLKNLLCGATTVVHHGPKYRAMYRKDFPVRVFKNYGWAHSLHFNTEEEIVQSYRNTPKNWPWFIHLAEGTDEVAAGEYRRLKQLGCVGENTVIVHGVGLTSEDIEDAVLLVRGLVWCPSTNNYLLGKTNEVHDWTQKGGDVALGNDSRLTANGDFADEILEAQFKSAADVNFLWEALSVRAANILGNQACLQTNADFVCGSIRSRSRKKLILINGIPQIGSPDILAKFTHIQTVPAILDGVSKAIHIDLARRIHQCKLNEPGLEVDALPKGKRFWLF